METVLCILLVLVLFAGAYAMAACKDFNDRYINGEDDDE